MGKRDIPFLAAVMAVGLAGVIASVAVINARMIAPSACPFGAAKTVAGWVCLSERDLEILAERCYLTEECETPHEHRDHGPAECHLYDFEPLPGDEPR